jgi:pSer/pThr/pTyr-binding forkhead associated (FHA) protein
MPSESHQSHLLVIQDDKGRRGVLLERPEYTVGRDPLCDIRLASQFVSRRHALLLRIPNDDGTYSYRIVDGSSNGKPSANGLLINGRRLRMHNLQNEDEVVFGPQVSVVYHSFEREPDISGIPDEFDITLINPKTAGTPDETPGALRFSTDKSIIRGSVGRPIRLKLKLKKFLNYQYGDLRVVVGYAPSWNRSAS